jgi:hypothetical protein
VTSNTTPPLLLSDADGTLYAIPQTLLAQCRLSDEEAARVRAENEVTGYGLAPILIDTGGWLHAPGETVHDHRGGSGFQGAPVGTVRDHRSGRWEPLI